MPTSHPASPGIWQRNLRVVLHHRGGVPRSCITDSDSDCNVLCSPRHPGESPVEIHSNRHDLNQNDSDSNHSGSNGRDRFPKTPVAAEWKSGCADERECVCERERERKRESV